MKIDTIDGILKYRPSPLSNKIEKVYSLEYTKYKIQLFFTQHHGQWRQKGKDGNNKPNNDMIGNISLS